MFLSNIIVWILKFVFRILMALVAIPFGVWWCSNRFFPEFTHAYDFWFWSCFGVVTVICYYILWKPILWISGLSVLFDAGNEL